MGSGYTGGLSIFLRGLLTLSVRLSWILAGSNLSIHIETPESWWKVPKQRSQPFKSMGERHWVYILIRGWDLLICISAWFGAEQRGDAFSESRIPFRSRWNYPEWRSTLSSCIFVINPPSIDIFFPFLSPPHCGPMILLLSDLHMVRRSVTYMCCKPEVVHSSGQW